MIDFQGILDYDKIDFKIYEFPKSYVITTFKIGTRIFENTDTLLNSFDYHCEIGYEDDVFELLSDNSKSVYILIKNPIDRFITGAVQVTFQGSCPNTAAYSLAKWGSESYYFTELFPSLSNNFPIYADRYDPNISMKKFNSILDIWKIWIEIVYFNIKLHDGHLSEYHKMAYNNLYKDILTKYNVSIIEDIDFKKNEVYKRITHSFIPSLDFSNSRWNGYVKENIINTIDYTENIVRFHPGLVSPITIQVEKYISNELKYYQILKKLIK